MSAILYSILKVKQSDKTVVAKAEFIVTYTWPKECSDDVDAYVEDPNGDLCFFRAREVGLMHLDRDDLGKRNDIIQTPFGPVEYQENREIITLRGTMAGEYVINAHMYLKVDRGKPTPVIVQVDKVNPFSTVMVKELVLENSGDEKTAVRFTVDKEGEVTDVNFLEKSLIQSGRESNRSGDPYGGGF